MLRKLSALTLTVTLTTLTLIIATQDLNIDRKSHGDKQYPTTVTPQERELIREAIESGRLGDDNFPYFMRQFKSDPKREGAIGRALSGEGNWSRNIHEISAITDKDALIRGWNRYWEEKGLLGGTAELIASSLSHIVAGAGRAITGQFSDRPINDIIATAQLIMVLVLVHPLMSKPLNIISHAIRRFAGEAKMKAPFAKHFSIPEGVARICFVISLIVGGCLGVAGMYFLSEEPELAVIGIIIWPIAVLGGFIGCYLSLLVFITIIMETIKWIRKGFEDDD